MASTNIELTRRVLDEVWNKRNLAVIDELVANDFVLTIRWRPRERAELRPIGNSSWRI
jgi:hypothetical protein